MLQVQFSLLRALGYFSFVICMVVAVAYTKKKCYLGLKETPVENSKTFSNQKQLIAGMTNNSHFFLSL